jgi:flagellar biosynthetic protein FliS
MVATGYARTYRANAILTASPGQLVLMLYDGALKAIAIAREGFNSPVDDPRRIEVINHQLLKAQAILTELQNGLNLEAGGEFAQTCGLLVQDGGPRTYSVDLSAYGTADVACAAEGLQFLPAGSAWGAAGSNITNFRLDLTEGTLDTPFTLSNVKLAADDEQTLPTGHAKIRVWQLPSATRGQVEAMLGELRSVVDAQADRIRRGLKNHVPEYQSPAIPVTPMRIVAEAA